MSCSWQRRQRAGTHYKRRLWQPANQPTPAAQSPARPPLQCAPPPAAAPRRTPAGAAPPWLHLRRASPPPAAHAAAHEPCAQQADIGVLQLDRKGKKRQGAAMLVMAAGVCGGGGPTFSFKAFLHALHWDRPAAALTAGAPRSASAAPRTRPASSASASCWPAGRSDG